MQTNLTLSEPQTNFRAQVSKKFIKEATNFYSGIGKNPTKIKQILERAESFQLYGYDDYFIKYVKKNIDGERKYILLAVKKGMPDEEGTILTAKNKFRKAVEKFIHITKKEFVLKMKGIYKINKTDKKIVD